MKNVVLVLTLILISVQSFSQVVRDRAFYEQKAIRYNRMKNTGAALTVTGSILTVVGMVCLSTADWETTEDMYGNSQRTASGSKAVGGAVSLVAGVGFLGAGIPLAIIGSKNKRKYESKAQSLSFRFNAKPNNTGLVLTYKF